MFVWLSVDYALALLELCNVQIHLTNLHIMVLFDLLRVHFNNVVFGDLFFLLLYAHLSQLLNCRLIRSDVLLEGGALGSKVSELLLVLRFCSL